jgi:2-polyprenyl-3-methyl-5-hydroxy-6-metoxy-1,4-benzoquinol methylase
MNCPNCNSDNILNYSKISNVWDGAGVVSFCNNCELYFLEKIPEQNKIDEYYKNENYRYSKIKYFVKNIFRKFRSASQSEYIKNNIKELDNKKILEIGACDGLLLSYFKNSLVTGTEYSSAYKEFALKKYGINLSNENFFDFNEKFDLIIMSHVLEHLPDLNIAIEKLKKLLNDGGYLFVEVPNSPRLKERDKKYIDDYLTITTPHIYNFTEKSLKEVFTKNDFNIISFNRFFYNFPNFYNIKSQEKIAEILLKGSGLKFKYILPVVFYLIKSVINPKKSYKKINDGQCYSGLGDNLRIILNINFEKDKKITL